jgi:hypothetical protein
MHGALHNFQEDLNGAIMDYRANHIESKITRTWLANDQGIFS